MLTELMAGRTDGEEKLIDLLGQNELALLRICKDP